MLNKFTRLIVVFACISWSCAGHAAHTILVLGDSISAAYGVALDDGWVALLDQHLKSEGVQAEVINASISGETTQGGLARLPALIAAHQPDIVVLELGANDGLRGFPLAHIRGNLQQMIDLSQQSEADVVLLGMRIPPNYGQKYTSLFYANYQQLAQAADIPLVPFFLDGVAAEDGMMQDDGLHPGAAAQPVLLRNALPAILPLLTTAPAQAKVSQ
jgi:acyl-CoA thioesterase-1